MYLDECLTICYDVVASIHMDMADDRQAQGATSKVCSVSSVKRQQQVVFSAALLVMNASKYCVTSHSASNVISQHTDRKCIFTLTYRY